MAAPLRLFSFGDIHNNLPCMGSAVAFINKAVEQGKCDIVVQAGDLCSSSADASTSQLKNLKTNYFDKIKVPYFVIPGNHDVIGSTCHSGCSNHIGSSVTCNYKTVYGTPNWLKTFVKDGITYQIIGVSICPADSSTAYYWIFDFAQSGISKTNPTIVLNHGPIVKPADTSCGSWSKPVYTYAITQGLKAKMDALNVLISYTGHVHAPRQTLINGRLYISENTISDNNERCTEDSTRFIGYTKITPNSDGTFTTQYKVIRYRNADGTVPAFVDPFPDIVPPPVLKWKCSGSPDYTCVQAVDGIYATQAECQATCTAPLQPAITPAMLMARIQLHLVNANKINPTIPLIQSQNMDGAVYIYKLPITPPVYVFTSSAAIDCDGQACTPCNPDPTNLGDTSFHQSDGQPLAPCLLPWYVLPETPNPIFDYANNDIRGGQLGIVINGLKMSYGVFGDERGRDVGNSEGKAIGEISYAMAQALGINPDPANGGLDSGVTYIVFTSSSNIVAPIESISAAKIIGDREILKLYDALGSLIPPSPTQIEISNIRIPSKYTQNTLAVGSLFYIDRTYKFTSIPSSYLGLKYIRTATDDRYRTESNFLQFDVNIGVTIFVAFDDRISPKPSWLSSFKDTGDNVVRDSSTTFSIYARDYPAGLVSLGGTSIPSGGAGGSYIVIVKPSSI